MACANTLGGARPLLVADGQCGCRVTREEGPEEPSAGGSPLRTSSLSREMRSQGFSRRVTWSVCVCWIKEGPWEPAQVKGGQLKICCLHPGKG